MQTKSRCHHRYILSEDAFFVTEDGIEVFIAGDNSQNFHVCGHVDFPLEMNEVPQKEKRVTTQASQQLFLNVIDLF